MLSGPRPLASAERTFGYFLYEYLARNDGSHRSANRCHGAVAEALSRIVDGARRHRPGWDMTFSAPKSVSLKALYRDRWAAMHAHDATVRATLDRIEREQLQIRGHDPATGRRPRVTANGMIAATFRHMASRNCKLVPSRMMTCRLVVWPGSWHALFCGLSARTFGVVVAALRRMGDLQKRFSRTVMLSPDHLARDMGPIVEGIVEQLTTLPGAEVSPRLEIDPEVAAGLDRAVQ